MAGIDTSGIASGLQAGFNMMQSVQDRKDKKAQQDREYGLQLQDREERRAQQAKLDARQAAADERNAADYAVKAADEEKKSTVSRFSDIATKYGTFEAAPQEVRDAATEAARKADDLINQSRTKRNELAFGKQRQDLSNVISNLQTGRVKLEDVPPDQLYQAVANATRRDPTDFMPGPDGAPAPVAKAVGDITTGMETNNKGMMLQGANVLLAPELRRGVGTESAHGGKILAKEIVDFVPHPNDPNRTTPVIKVYVDEGKNVAGPRGPHGATSWYLAPLTEDRSSRPDATVGFIDMKAAMDRVGQMGMLTEVMSQPQFLARMEEGQRLAGSRTKELIDRYFMEGQNAAPKKQYTSTVPAMPANSGKTMIRTTDAQGREVKREVIDNPKHVERTGALEKRLALIDRMREDGDLSDVEANEAELAAFNIRPRAGRGGGGGVGKDGKPTEAAVKGAIADVTKALAADEGLRFSGVTKSWVNADGSPAKPEALARLDKKAEAAATRMRDGAAKGKLVPMSEALDEARKPEVVPPKPEPSRFKVGQMYTNPKGQKAIYQADNTWKEVK